MEFPVLIKPVVGAGGRGIHYFDKASEASAFLRAHGTACLTTWCKATFTVMTSTAVCYARMAAC
jgi:biotin carboxylase